MRLAVHPLRCYIPMRIIMDDGVEAKGKAPPAGLVGMTWSG